MRKKKTSQKVVIAILSGALLFIPVAIVMATPKRAYAADVTLPDHGVNDGTTNIEANEEMNTNNGIIEVNNGELTHNHGYVERNNNYIEDNTAGATIENNGGEVRTNNGLIVNNTGRVTYVSQGNITNNYGSANYVEGIVENNSGVLDFFRGNVEENSGRVVAIKPYENTIGTNHAGGEVFGSNATINNNYGTVWTSEYLPYGSDSELHITNHYSGTLSVIGSGDDDHLYITNNYSGQAYDSGKVLDTNRFLSVTVENVNNADVTYDRPGFVHNDTDDKEYIQVKKDGQVGIITGSITLTPQEGYKITNEGAQTGTTEKLAYVLSRNTNGSYTVTITNITGHETISPELLHLIISEMEEANDLQEINDGEPIVISDAKIVETPPEDSSSDANTISMKNDFVQLSENSDVATPNFTQEAINSIQAQIQTQVSQSEQTGNPLEILDLYFDKKIDMNPMLIRFLCEKIALAKRCHFNYKDKEYILFIPTFDISDPAYKQGLDMLDKEPAKTAGFLRIEQLFKPLGFAVKIEDDTETDAATQN